MADNNEMNVQSGNSIWGPPRRVQAVEIIVFLLLIVPAMSASFFIGTQSNLKFIPVAVSSILNDISLIALVLYFVWRNGEPFFRLGLTANIIIIEIGFGFLLYFPIMFIVNILGEILQSAGLSMPSKTPSFLAASGPLGIVLGIILVIVVAIVEETIFRGYLILRLRTVTGSTLWAVIFSSIIFSIGHGYEGIAGVITIFFLGVVLALIYIWRASLIAPMIIHFLIDFGSIVLGSLLKK